MRSEGISPKNEEQNGGLSATRMFQHTQSDMVKNFLAKKNVTTLYLPPYSPALHPVDFYLFFRIKSALKWRLFCEAADIIKNENDDLKKVFTTWLPEMFPKILQILINVYSCKWEYFEGKVA
jgi:hypothetical protein